MNNNARAQTQVSPRGDTYRARVLLDVDGVVCDFITGGLRILGELGITARVDDVTHYQMEKLLPDHLHEEFGRRIRERGFCSSLQPYPDARDFVFALTTHYEVAAVTAAMPMHETWAHERTEWLREMFNLDRIISTAHKEWIAGDYLVEDSMPNAERWAAMNPGGRVLLLDRPYNRVGSRFGEQVERCRTLANVLDAIELHERSRARI